MSAHFRRQGHGLRTPSRSPGTADWWHVSSLYRFVTPELGEVKRPLSVIAATVGSTGPRARDTNRSGDARSKFHPFGPLTALRRASARTGRVRPAHTRGTSAERREFLAPPGAGSTTRSSQPAVAVSVSTASTAIPDESSARRQLAAVAPEVMTSSTSTVRTPSPRRRRVSGAIRPVRTSTPPVRLRTRSAESSPAESRTPGRSTRQSTTSADQRSSDDSALRKWALGCLCTS